MARRIAVLLSLAALLVPATAQAATVTVCASASVTVNGDSVVDESHCVET